MDPKTSVITRFQCIHGRTQSSFFQIGLVVRRLIMATFIILIKIKNFSHVHILYISSEPIYSNPALFPSNQSEPEAKQDEPRRVIPEFLAQKLCSRVRAITPCWSSARTW